LTDRKKMESKKSVLVVEDDFFIRTSIVQILSEEGYEVAEAANGKDALEYLSLTNRRPSVIILDLMMPVMDGWQFRSAQMNDPALNKIPVVVVTADGNARVKAKQMNAEGWVKKPIEIDSLLKAVNDCSS